MRAKSSVSYQTTPYPTHRFAGVNSDRQSIGLPGHCERCAEVGHVRAHPSLGCGDVGCEKGHGDADEAAANARSCPPSAVAEQILPWSDVQPGDLVLHEESLKLVTSIAPGPGGSYLDIAFREDRRDVIRRDFIPAHGLTAVRRYDTSEEAGP